VILILILKMSRKSMYPTLMFSSFFPRFFVFFAERFLYLFLGAFRFSGLVLY